MSFWDNNSGKKIVIIVIIIGLVLVKVCLIVSDIFYFGLIYGEVFIVKYLGVICGVLGYGFGRVAVLKFFSS